MKGNRLDRVNSEIKKVLSGILSKDIRDPRLSGMICITGVRTSADLSHAKIYVSIFDADHEERSKSFEALEKSSGYIRTLLSQKLDMRITPELKFILDTGADESCHIAELLSRLDIPKEE